MVAIPLGNDQPGVAARVKARGAAVVLSRTQLTADRVAAAVRTVLQDASYRAAAKALQAEFRKLNGISRASDVIEDALKIRFAAPTPSSAESKSLPQS